MKEYGFALKEAKSRQNHAETITDADYADDIALLANAPTQGESRLHYLQKTVGDIGLHVNADKSDYICFNQVISTLNSCSLKLLDKFRYLDSNVLSTENDIHIG